MEDGIERNITVLYNFKDNKNEKENIQLNNYLYICIPENGLLENSIITDNIKNATEYIMMNKKGKIEIFKKDDTTGFYKII